MTNKEADEKLKELGLSRKWLAEKSGYKVTSLYTAINGPEKELTMRMSDAFQRAFDAEQQRRDSPFTDQDKLWDGVYFSATETMRIDAARKISAHDSLEEFFHDAVCWQADRLIAEEKARIVKFQNEAAAAEEPAPFNSNRTHKPNSDTPEAE